MRENNIPFFSSASHFASVYLCVRMCLAYTAVLDHWELNPATSDGFETSTYDKHRLRD